MRFLFTGLPVKNFKTYMEKGYDQEARHRFEAAEKLLAEAEALQRRHAEAALEFLSEIRAKRQ